MLMAMQNLAGSIIACCNTVPGHYFNVHLITVTFDHRLDILSVVYGLHASIVSV